MKGDFLKCGVLGWGMKIFWTGLHALGSENWKLTRLFFIMDVSHIWNGSVYRASFKEDEETAIRISRRCLYGGDFYSGVFFRYVFLKHYNMCPWDYSNSPFQYKGVIRLDYAPVWFLVGIIYEKFLKCRSNCYMIVRDDKV